jgi:hypothetical protein
MEESSYVVGLMETQMETSTQNSKDEGKQTLTR